MSAISSSMMRVYMRQITIFFFIGAILSIFFLPVIFSILITVIGSFFVPYLPLLSGVLLDVLYFAPQSAAIPFYTVCGLVLTVFVLFVRRHLKTSII